MDASEQCRVDECDRRAAASIVRDHLPGPLPLCLIHTEDFRMNGAGWNIAWDRALPEPTSVTVAVAAGVGRQTPLPVATPAAPSPDSAVQRVKSRFTARRNSRR
jgi:hypothetical protein